MMVAEQAPNEPRKVQVIRSARTAIASLVMAFTLAMSATAAPVCLQSYLIHNTSITNSHTILFHMKDGTVWRNTLRNSCPDLKWYGFEYDVHGPEEICDNLQSIRIIHTGETCLLGAFTREPSAHAAHD